MARIQFQPQVYYNTLATREPVCVIQPGDTVVTSTVDAGGHDSTGSKVTKSPNPQTGPFLVQGAQPGDALAVTLDRLTPSRSSGYSGSGLVGGVLEAGHSIPPGEPFRWRLDLHAGTAVPVDATAALPELPLDPMLGCFGVAPEGGAEISASTPGRHGGNMDCRRFREGTTAYLPVFAAGALLSVGDGHALQGDGEIAGMGIEVSFDVEFTVRLLKGWTIQWPRGADNSGIFTVGAGAEPQEALQHATSEMVRWLEVEYGLTSRDAAVLLSQVGGYEVANLCNPLHTMACRMPGRFLPAVPLQT